MLEESASISAKNRAYLAILVSPLSLQLYKGFRPIKRELEGVVSAPVV